MGIGDFISDITPDSVEDAVEDGVEWAGNKIEGAGNWTADRLEDVGWETGADWVREQSRSVANRMGAEVDEMDLGQTEDKTKLIYGSPDKIRSTAEKLRGFQTAFDNAGDGLRGLDSSKLKGEAAEALRKAVSTQPPKWFTGADACEKAAAALEAFAGTVTWAQGQAQTAIDKWKEGVKASEEAADAHRKKVDDFNKAVDRYNAQPEKYDLTSLPPRPSPTFEDPGKKLMQDAQDILADARKQRNTAAETARSAVRAARDTAPEKPTYAEQALSGLQEMQIMGDHVGGGIIKGTAGLVNFVRGINPLDPYNITHPAEYTTNLNNLAAGLVLAANDPVGTGKQMVSDFMKDPYEGFGRLIPDAALTAATGGGGAAVKG
ncbi:putative T7SS-secreted protein, partial [Streptomyces sp. CO7]